MKGLVMGVAGLCVILSLYYVCSVAKTLTQIISLDRYKTHVSVSTAANYTSAGMRSTLVVYSGPTSLGNELYMNNFEYFLEHGLPSSSSPQQCDLGVKVVLVLTEMTLSHYMNAIESYNSTCGELRTATRQDRCYDMESARVVLTDSSHLNFDRLVFVNCGTIGPFMQSLASPYWAFAFTNMIDDEVKLSGMTISCGGRPDFPDDKIAHVQTMVWSTDQVGLSVILDSGSIYDCGNQLEEEHGRDALVVKYEIGMSRAIMESGFAIRDRTGQRYTWETAKRSDCPQLWHDKSLVTKYPPDNLIFWKVSLEHQRRPLAKWLEFKGKWSPLLLKWSELKPP